MRKGLTEIIFLLDRSGSMAGLESDTIGGYNSMLTKQKKGEGEVLVSTVLFDDIQKVLYDRVPLDKVPLMTEKEYYVRGCTALLDAVGSSVHHIGNVYKYAREEDRPEKTIFIITTDGLENSSQSYSYKKVKEMVERQKNSYGWEFIFLGANIDAVAEAGRIGIAPQNSVRFECDKEGVSLNYDVLSETICEIRANKCMPAGWKDRIEADYKKRGKRQSIIKSIRQNLLS